jgi:hypothetical protein
MQRIGIIEGFFGPEWSWESRHHVCASMRETGGAYYIYAPKRDPFLRKRWTEEHPTDQWNELLRLRAKCKDLGVGFGVGLSPFEVHSHWDQSTKEILKRKLKKLEELELDMLGLFFDDMRGSPDLAEIQTEIVSLVRANVNLEILFCPTYYTDDPILDKVFGQRPPEYLETIGRLIPSDVQILWTGPKVISQEIAAEGLKEVERRLKRKPFIWDNYFANDGPKQCKFLKLKPLTGRSRDALEASAGWMFNPMNQPALSELVCAHAIDVLTRGADPASSFSSTMRSMGGEAFSRLIIQYGDDLRAKGLDALDEATREAIRSSIAIDDHYARDVFEWLDGRYNVGAECLTD